MNQSDYHKLTPTFDATSAYEKVWRLFNFEGGTKLNILDVGSGNGTLGQKLILLGHMVTGLDINAESLKYSWVKECDITKEWPVTDHSFDLAICTDVAEHIEDPEHILQSAKLVLKPDGLLLFGVPNHFDLRQRWNILRGKGIVHWDDQEYSLKSWNYMHLRFFTLDELRELFSKNGFTIQAEQFNFMGGGIIPTRLTPTWLRTWLTKTWPNLFSGKFIFLLSSANKQTNVRTVIMPKTPEGF